MLTGLIVCTALASPARADCTEPFDNVGELIACSALTATHPTELYVDGHKVAQLPGTGFPVVRQYFNCTDIGIKHLCNTGAVTGVAWLAALQDGYLTWQYASIVLGQGLNVYLDNVLVRDRGTGYTLSLKTCHGDQSVQGPVTYYVVESMFDGFGPPYWGDCF